MPAVFISYYYLVLFQNYFCKKFRIEAVQLLNTGFIPSGMPAGDHPVYERRILAGKIQTECSQRQEN